MIQFSLKVYKKLKHKDLENTVIIIPSRPVEIIYFIAKLKRKKNIKVPKTAIFGPPRREGGPNFLLTLSVHLSVRFNSSLTHVN